MLTLAKVRIYTPSLFGLMENGKGVARALFSVTSFMYTDTGRTLCNGYQLSVVTFMTKLRK